MTVTANQNQARGRHRARTRARSLATNRRRGLRLTALILVAIFSAGCGGDASPATTPAPPPGSSSGSPSTATPSAATDPSADPSESAVTNASINPRAPLTQQVDARFDPSFTLRIPASWTAVLRDRSDFQVYAGNEDFEITFDHTYRSKESVADAIARLVSADRLRSVAKT